MLTWLHVGISFSQTPFVTINLENGLSNGSVTDIVQDSIGFLWIATKQGLNRYDATSIKIFDSKNSVISSDAISDILLDENGRIWISTIGGELAFYDAGKDSLQLISISNCVFNKGITLLSLKDKNHIWIGAEEGLFLFEINTNSCSNYSFPSKNNDTIQPEISDIVTLSSGKILVSTFGHGLWNLNNNANQLVKIESVNSSIPEYLLTLHQYPIKDHEILIGTQGNGLLQYNLKTNRIIPFFASAIYQNTIVRTLHLDRSENLWIGTDGNGLLYASQTNNVKEITSNFSSITAISQDRQGNVWFGTARDGLIVQENKWQLDSPLLPLNGIPVLSVFKNKDRIFLGMDGEGLNIKQPLQNNWQNTRPNGANYVQFIQQNKNENLWLGTFSNGLLEYHIDRGVIRHFRHIINDTQSLSFNDVRDMVEMPDGNIWVATWGGGLNFYNSKKGSFTAYKDESLNSNNVVDLERTEKGLWLATFGGGLVFMDFQTRQFTPYILQKNKDENNHEEAKNLLSLSLDSQGVLWIGTWKNGLYRFNTQTGDIQWLNDEVIKDQTITSILEDSVGDLWLSTKEGILCLNKKDSSFLFFSEYAGQYHINSKYKDENGQLYFGGKSGVVTIKPESLKDSKPLTPPVVLTEIRIFDKKRKAANQGVIQKNISRIEQMDLRYSQNTISIYFATLDFPNAKKWEYAIQLEGLEEHWREIGNQNNTTFTNLPSGKYEFRVKTRFRGGNWNEDYATLAISVSKPFWATGWAYLTYSMLIALALFLFRKYTIAWENMRHKMQMEALLHQKDKELHQAKQRFFNNISHEIRTPLTLMFAAMNQLKKAGVHDPRQLSPLKTLQNNARHLLNLVDELLSFRKMESGAISLQMAEVDLVAFAHEIFLAFGNIFENKNIRTEFKAKGGRIMASIDPTQMEKVIYNLLSNAHKFSKTDDAIIVSIKKDDEYAYLVVSDTGIGIPKEKQQQIFQRFYQQEHKESIQEEGFGIGLSIVQDIVELHEGKVWVESKVNEGSTFIVKLPLIVSQSKMTDNVTTTSTNQINKSIIETARETEEYTLLIVEDNVEIRTYLKDLLSPQYAILEAANGMEGLKIACDHLPDLIISDVLMPLKNGIELVKEVKADVRSSHIPIILLTSRVGWIFKKEGFDIGADAYITKPFNEEILKSRIRNLITSRQEIWKSISIAALTRPQELAISNPDRLFLEQFITIIETNIQETTLSPDIFAKKMGISHSIIYKKLKQLTGMSIVEFIRDFRLKRAADMLQNKQGSIKEISYSCGFSDRRYFTRVFKEKYGMVPSDYGKDSESFPL